MLSGRHTSRCNDLLVYHIMEPIPAKVKLLHPSMMLWVLGYRNGTVGLSISTEGPVAVKVVVMEGCNG
jgi:hypothetical protein